MPDPPSTTTATPDDIEPNDPEAEPEYEVIAFLDDDDVFDTDEELDEDVTYTLFFFDAGPRPDGDVTVRAELASDDVRFETLHLTVGHGDDATPVTLGVGAVNERGCTLSEAAMDCTLNFGEVSAAVVTNEAPRRATTRITRDIEVMAFRAPTSTDEPTNDRGQVEIAVDAPVEPSAAGRVAQTDDPFNDARKQQLLVFLLCVIAVLLMLIIARQPTMQARA
ncbi:MAG: hypothetical protein AAF548_08820 [Actinomycetota bacterium]